MKFKKTIIWISIVLSLLLLLIIFSCFFYFFHIPKKYKVEVEATASQFNVDKNLIYAVMKVESNFKANAVSRVGAVGLMQIMPQTANFICMSLKENLDVYNYKDNIKMGVWYLRYLQNKFTNMTNMLAAYNAGEGTVQKWLQQTDITENGVLQNIPYKETACYVKKVEKFYRWYTKIKV